MARRCCLGSTAWRSTVRICDRCPSQCARSTSRGSWPACRVPGAEGREGLLQYSRGAGCWHRELRERNALVSFLSKQRLCRSREVRQPSNDGALYEKVRRSGPPAAAAVREKSAGLGSRAARFGTKAGHRLLYDRARQSHSWSAADCLLVMRNEFRTCFGNLHELVLERLGDSGMKGASRIAQERAIGRVLDEGMLEQIARVWWHVLSEK